MNASPGVAGGGGPSPERLDRPFDDPLFARLFPPLAVGVQWGLERTEQALASLGNPHRRFPTIHVGGTNGKGSVTATVAAVLADAGLRTGCYTSPHLCSIRERIVVDGRALEDETLLARAAEVREVVSRFGLTFFEAVTVLGFHAFAREGVHAAVIEVGLGGRLDATNVIRPQVSVVTNVQMDHADYLGNTLAKIAREKAGIAKAGVPFVVGETQPELTAVFREAASAVGAPFHPVDAEARIRDLVLARDRTEFTVTTRAWGELRLSTPLVGRHQASNAVLAVEALEHLGEPLRPGRDALVRGLAGVVHPGRDQIEIVDGKTWLFDVAHNTAGIHSLVDTLDRLELPRPFVALVGVLGDKDWPSMLPPLFSRAELAVLTQPPPAPPVRRCDPRAAGAAAAGAGALRVEEDFLTALSVARAAAGEGTVVVTGSCHTVGSALTALGLEPLRAE